MANIPIALPPGVYANGTEYQAAGRWRDSNLVRWWNGRMRPVGGWQRFTTAALDAPVRGLFTWRDNNGARFLAAGTADKLYAHDGGAIYDITPTGLVAGNVDSLYGLGWGADLYGTAAYGTPRASSGLIFDACTWSLDAFGQYLVACSTADGTPYVWRGTSDAKALPMANAPLMNRGMFVTDERMVVLLGAGGDPRNVQWCAQGDYTLWTPAATNTAGSIKVNSVGVLVAGHRFVSGQYLLFTDIDVHTMSYVGQPFVYGLNRVGDKCGLVGKHAKAPVALTTGTAIVWMGQSNFYIYDGTVRALPCEVQERVFNDFNGLQGAKVCAGVNSQFGEVWFFYPSATSVENNRYVVWNYRENTWYVGALPRTAWADRDAWPYPVAAGVDCQLYQHEQGWTDSGLSRVGNVYAESGPIGIGAGDNVMNVSTILLDSNAGEAANLSLSFFMRKNPQAPETQTQAYKNPKANGEIDARFGAKQVRVRVDIQADGPFDFGTLRLDATKGEGR
jgi:hypothetical protein